MANVYRKHPLSIAISMALLAAAATSAMAESAGAPDPAQQDGPTTPSPDAKKAKSAAGMEADDLQEITVVGVRQSQIRAIELKRQGRSADETATAVQAEFQANYPGWAAPARVGILARTAYAEGP